MGNLRWFSYVFFGIFFALFGCLFLDFLQMFVCVCVCAKLALGDVFYCYILSVTLSDTTSKYNGYDARWEVFDISYCGFYVSFLNFDFLLILPLLFHIWSNTNFRIDAINNTILILSSNCPTFQSHPLQHKQFLCYFSTIQNQYFEWLHSKQWLIFSLSQTMTIRKLNWKSEAFLFWQIIEKFMVCHSRNNIVCIKKNNQSDWKISINHFWIHGDKIKFLDELNVLLLLLSMMNWTAKILKNKTAFLQAKKIWSKDKRNSYMQRNDWHLLAHKHP